jgi:hypothetical protein
MKMPEKEHFKIIFIVGFYISENVANINMDLREIGWGDVDWIHLA